MKIDGIEVHESVTAERVAAAAEAEMTTLDNPGICIACGAEQEGVEPDAEKYRCAACGRMTVYGAENLLIRMM